VTLSILVWHTTGVPGECAFCICWGGAARGCGLFNGHGPQAPSPATCHCGPAIRSALPSLNAAFYCYKQNTNIPYHYFSSPQQKICDPLPASGNTPTPCLPERSAATKATTRLKMGAQSKDPGDFYRTKTASGSSTKCSVPEKTHFRQVVSSARCTNVNWELQKFHWASARITMRSSFCLPPVSTFTA
jgi:hypothetical protein